MSDWRPINIGLTGSIGMGKSTVAKHFHGLGCPIFDADQCVHQLYSVGGAAVERIQEIFPETIIDGAVDRPTLGRLVLSNSDLLQTLENIVHPLVFEERRKFMQLASENKTHVCVYDIPLLLENRHLHDYVDEIVVVSTSREIQLRRVLERTNMTMEKFQQILSKQMPDEQKRLHASFIIDTSAESLEPARLQVIQVMSRILEKYSDRLGDRNC